MKVFYTSLLMVQAQSKCICYIVEMCHFIFFCAETVWTTSLCPFLQATINVVDPFSYLIFSPLFPNFNDAEVLNDFCFSTFTCLSTVMPLLAN